MELFIDKDVKAKRAERARLAQVLKGQHAELKSIEECQVVMVRNNQHTGEAYTVLQVQAKRIQAEMAYIAGEMAETGLMTC